MSSKDPFTRKVIYLHPSQIVEEDSDPNFDLEEPKAPPTVLVINSSNETAKAITSEITSQIPGCFLVYAPTIALASYIMRRREIDLIISDRVLPDGGVDKLRIHLKGQKNPPDLVVVGSLGYSDLDKMADCGYRMRSVERIAGFAKPRKVGVSERVRGLGADIRNDLNNPLQEIVAMVFVAQQADAASPITRQALDAIDEAAQNMANYVTGLESKIQKVVGE